MQDLRTILADIKDTLSSTISNLHLNIQALVGRVQEVQRTAAQQGSTIRQVTQTVDTHMLKLRDMHLYTEDLDNRGRRHNLRFRSLPESVEHDQLLTTVTGFC